MDILQTILNTQDGGAVRQLGSQFGLPPEKTQSALSALVPALAAGLQRNMGSEGGLEGLLSALTTGGHERYLEDPTILADPATTEDGNGILSHLFGSKDVSRRVAQRAADQTGIGVGTLKQMLPLVAAMVMGGLSRNAVASSDSGPVAAPARAGGLMAMLTPLLDRNRDGSMIDDVIGMAGSVLGRTNS
ncbi:MAG TPA: DUF937 domain-containing protein [Thermoanaerobaculia bacterium]|nr:DUF937 domain-containing protein [Thermoanaerobaculia bacterium]